MVIKMR